LASEASGLGGIAQRYATALYDLGEGEKSLDAVADDLRAVQEMIDASEDLRRLIRSPLITRDDQWQAVEGLLEKAEMSALTRRFIGVITDNRRLFALPTIIAAFLRLLAARRGEITAQVTTAVKLDAEQTAALTETLKATLGAKVAVEPSVDPEILGGMVVRVGSRMFDSSLRTKLTRMQLAMKGIG
jgi:F-type H+-transporting ATPase subunit delta